MTHVPYKGAAPAMTAVLAGEVSMFCGPIPQSLPHVRAGKVLALGTTGAKPSPLTPEVRPLSATFPDVVLSNWYAMFAPARTPSAVLATLQAAVRRVQEDPALARRLEESGLDPLWLGPAELAVAVDRDLHTDQCTGSRRRQGCRPCSTLRQADPAPGCPPHRTLGCTPSRRPAWHRSRT